MSFCIIILLFGLVKPFKEFDKICGFFTLLLPLKRGGAEAEAAYGFSSLFSYSLK